MEDSGIGYPMLFGERIKIDFKTSGISYSKSFYMFGKTNKLKTPPSDLMCLKTPSSDLMRTIDFKASKIDQKSYVNHG